MTRDEIKNDSFKRITTAVSIVFPGIKTSTDGDILEFDDGAVKVELTSNDIDEGQFNVTNDGESVGEIWGIKPTVSLVVKEVCNIRKQKVLATIH